MEINVIEKSKNKIVFELKGEDDTFCNALKDELYNDSNVKIASYRIDHPLINIPRFILEIKSGDVKKSLVDATKRLKKLSVKFHDDFKKVAK
tara:strand:+ start:150 stop:425 length:276 start_codon:yes stop_codon:yes gene_type:complete